MNRELPLPFDQNAMLTSPGRTCRACFIVLLAVGFGFLLMGLVVVPLRPAFQLDVVLTPEELLNPHKRDATTALLEKAAGNEWVFWTAGGLVVTVTSAVGLRTVREAEWQKVRSDYLKNSVEDDHRPPSAAEGRGPDRRSGF